MDISNNNPHQGYADSENSLVSSFNQEYFAKAPLICHTPFLNTKWRMYMGFMAAETFHITNQFEGRSSDWLHDMGKLKLETSLYNNDQFTLITEFGYESFQRINVEVEDKSREFFDVYVTLATTCVPSFYSQIPDKQNRRKPFMLGRFNQKIHREPVEAFWEDLINASAFQIFYKFPKNQFNSWMQQLYSCSQLNDVTFKHLPVIRYEIPDQAKLDEHMREWPDDIKYYVRCIKSLGAIGHFFLDYRLFVKCDIDSMITAGGKFVESLATMYFRSMYTFLKRDISLSSLDFNATHFESLRRTDASTKYVPIKTVTITPTRRFYQLEEDEINCRGFRMLDHKKLIQVKFRDENLSWFPRENCILENSMLPVLLNGIFVGESKFFDFGCSSSLFREHGAYFFNGTQNEIVDIIKSWGKFKVEPAAKITARIGQYFTSAKEITVKLKISEIGELDDYKSIPAGIDDAEYVFSDGVGIIDPAYAREIQADFGLRYMPSAFQIRCLGCKGMITVDPYNKNLVSNGGNYKVMFRESQTKFEAPNDGLIDLDVAQFSAPCPVKLHRSFISLMVALARDQGKMEEVEKRLHELLSQAFMDIIKSLNDQEAFIRTLLKLPKFFPIAKFAEKNLINEPFLRSLVEAYAVFTAKLLNNKCQIPLPDNVGRSALGVVDETGLLKPGEIFFQYTVDIYSKESSPAREILEGPVGVTKSPMYHLGDIRYLKAVNIPQLEHLYDVVVFPNHGARPIPDEIGGGDLDGDTYCVFWDPALLLEHAEAANYAAADTSGVPKVANLDDLHRAHAHFRIEYELKNNLEQISNCHLVHLVMHHPNNDDVENIAKKADVAVNSFKSGLFAESLSKDERNTFNPSFMEKRHEPMFQSDHVLFLLHKRCTTFYTLTQIAQNASRKKREMKAKKEIKPTAVAKRTFERYSKEIKELMSKYKIKSEAELFANVFLEIPGVFSTYKLSIRDEDSIASTIQFTLFEIFDRYRTEFLDKFKPNWRRDKEARRETLREYRIPEEEVTQKMKDRAQIYYDLAENDGTCLSFPFIAFEGLEFDTPTGDSIKSKLKKELKRCVVEPVEINSQCPLQVYTAKYNDFELFAATIEAWLTKEKIDHYSTPTIIQIFLQHLSKSSINPSVPVAPHSFGKAFIDLLIMISSFKFQNIAEKGKEIYQAAQATLIQLAFSYNLPILSGTSLQSRVIPYPAFVISVPQFYSCDFQEQYKMLKIKSKCTDVAIRLRKTFPSFHQYTVCCKGTLQACQKLEDMLTPMVKYDKTSTISIIKMKELKTAAMQKRLEGIFGFTPPPENNLSHTQTIPERIGNTSRPSSTSRNTENDPFFSDPQLNYHRDHYHHQSI